MKPKLIHIVAVTAVAGLAALAAGTALADDDDCRVPIGNLVKTIRKLPKTLSPGQVTEVRKRLEALTNQPLPMPKGPVPKSTRAMRPPRR